MKTKTAVLRESTSIPYEIKVLLDSLVMSDNRPPELTKWAKKVFAAGHKHERTKEEIADWIVKYALEKDYSERQIERVLKDNGFEFRPYDNTTRRIRHMSKYNFISELEELAKAITKLNDKGSKITDIASRGTDPEKETLLYHVQIDIRFLQQLESALLEKSTKGIKLER